ncbi:chemotaxis protein [Herbaspirillum robiniae]|uniref:Chemotaxis protein n=1 Tax=Herbaspirillum robiniae TaxID=2014887 RepID=A0A2D0B5S5_9BURK|nr:chemotaxis protein [Herbaspirillum robiniae]NUU02892.1 chemotaxis protein [Herbaspirillum robiniae]OWY29665.1 chemotaxis protein [Herbaspirillum robiniae]
MPTKTMLHELKRLLLDTASGGSRQLTEVESDLVQTNILLGEAIGKLGTSFMDLHRSVQTQQDILEALMNGHEELNADSIAKLKETQNQVSQYVNAAVTGLQFQDMTSQLLERIVRRVIGLREALGVLSANSFEIVPEQDQSDVELEALLASTVKSIEERLTVLDNGLWKAVRQTRMESGDIELF